MTLSDLELPISYENAQQYALIFTPSLAARLTELHSQYGSPNCIPMPRTLIDGRLMLTADILYEIQPGGLLEQMWNVADKEIIGREVEVIPIAQALGLLPPTPIPTA
jgi:hypothetical protein